MPANDFIEAFHDEHRRMRDALLGLIEAFESSDQGSIRDGIAAMTADAVPHFDFERAALYPALMDFYDQNYLSELLAEHQAALEATRELEELGDTEELDSAATERGLELVRQLLPHVSDRDGLSMMFEVLPEEHIARIMKARADLERTGEKVRKVPVVISKRKAAKIKARASTREAGKTKAMHKKPHKAAAKRHAR